MTEQQTLKMGWFALFKQAIKGGNHNLTQGSIGQAAFLLAIPMVLEMLMESIFAVVDIFFVAGLGAEAVAVVGLTEAILTLLYALAIGLSMAVTAMVARRVGENNLERANQIAGQTLWIGLAVSLVVAIIGLNFSSAILSAMGASEQVLAIGSNYMQVMLGGSITIVYLFLINAIFRGAGDAAVAMRSLWLANGINIILDPMLIYGVGPFPEMGVTGAAVATNIGRGCGVLYQLYHLFGKKHRLSVDWQTLKIKAEICWSIIKLSVGGVSQFLIGTASWVALVRIVSTYGSEAVAGYTIAIRIILFTILPAWGLSNAVATLVGQNLGAGNPMRAEQSVWRVAKYNLVFMVTVAVVFIIFAPAIVSLFTQDARVTEIAVTCLRLISYGYGFFAIGMIVVQAFNGAGDTMTPTKINFLCYWLVQIPLAYGLAKLVGLGPEGVFWSITIAQSLLALVGVLIFRRGHWKEKVV